MSSVTNIMVSTMFQDIANAEAFAEWLRKHPEGYMDPAFEPGGDPPYSADLRESPKELWAGPRYNECDVWLGVLSDQANLGAVRERFAKIPWIAPNAVQLFLMTPGDLFFEVWMIRDGELRQYAPFGPGD